VRTNKNALKQMPGEDVTRIPCGVKHFGYLPA